jgi:3-hexulose-6-phosphate synthase / 6-phospho-3-hexuloisomerase
LPVKAERDDGKEGMMQTKSVNRLSKELIDAFRSIGTSTLGDVLDAMGMENVVPGLTPVKRGAIMVGPAFTVKEVSGLLGTYTIEDFCIGKVIDVAQPGDILVFDNGGKEISTWGGLAATAAKVKGIAGAVIDGGCRDLDQIAEMNFPVFSRHFTPRSAKTRIKILEMDGIIQCNGIRVTPGDLIVADATGVIVIPIEKAEEVLKLAMEAEKIEGYFMEELEKGKTFGEMQRRTGRL